MARNKLQAASTDTLLRQLGETNQLWTMYVRRAMKPRPTTVEGLEKKMAAIRAELQARGHQWNP